MAEDNPIKVSVDTDGTKIETGKGSPKKVLVVEDSMPLRRMLVKIMQTQKLEPTEAENGAVALQTLQEKTPAYFDLIICDLMMPVKDGAQFITDARAEFGQNLPPIVICSSRSDREAIQLVIKLGVSGYVLKPFKTETVISKVKETLNPPSSSSATGA